MSKLLECGSCEGVYATNHWLTSLCPSCTMIGQVYLMEAAPREKRQHFIKNILILAKLLSLDPEEQMKMSSNELKDWVADNYVPYVMVPYK